MAEELRTHFSELFAGKFPTGQGFRVPSKGFKWFDHCPGARIMSKHENLNLEFFKHNPPVLSLDPSLNWSSGGLTT